ncbi:MAG: choice-of-anchor J domain-containing protein, partial [Bacteroidota bacterium]
ICVGKPVVFTDRSTGNVTSRTWSFPGGTPSSSTAANPTVSYNAPGIYSVTLTVSNGSTSSTLTKTNYISTQGFALPLTEDFESGVFTPANWTNVDAGNNAIAWQQYNGVGGYGNSNGCMYFDNYSSDAQGARDEFMSPSLNLVGLGTARLVFDLAYQPYSLSSYVDSLRILISTDCGTTFTPLYTKWGSSLATVTGTNTAEFLPTSTQWRTDTVNLSSYIGQQVQVSFQNIGRYGNNLYIDNIRLQGTSGCNATIALNQANTRCIGQSTGSINATMNGGTGTITYTLSPGGISNSSGVFTGLSAGNYTVTAVDANQCSVSGSATIGYQYTVNATASYTNIQCFGTTSTVTVNGSGGVSPYSGTGTFTVSAGNYTYTITDANGCQASTSVSISQPVQLIASSTNTVINCFGGTSVVTVSATGGTSPYTGAGTFTVSAGIYTFTVTDANGCTASTNKVIQQPSQLVANSSAGSISCFGGSTSASITATGGTSPYSGTGNYPVTAGTSTFTVTDQNGCTANTSITIGQPSELNVTASASAIACFGGQSTVTVSASGGTPPYSGTVNFNRSAGAQSFTVTDATGCSKTISITINQPAAITPTIIATGPTTFCAGGSVILSAPSGYSAYSWSNGSTALSITTGVAGSYQVTVTDGSGCTGTSAHVTVIVNPILTATITISSNAPATIISSTTITFTATSTNGGSAPVYQWMKNGSPVGTNSFTYTGTGWSNGDVITCQMTSNAACVSPAVVTSNPITLNVQSLSPKYVVSDITANKVFYYDASFIFLQSNTLSGTALNSITNAADVFVTATHGYILDQTNKRIFRSSTPGSLPAVSRSLNTNTGTALSTPKGHCISGDTLWVLDQKGKAVYRYSLSACFTGTGTINAAAKLTLNSKNSAGEGLFSSGPYLYVLNNGTTKNLYRYLKSSGTNVLSRAMVNTGGTALSTVTGCALDGSIVNIVDAGLDRNLQYSLSSLFTGTGNLNASTAYVLQSTNLNSTGIALTNAILLRGPEETTSTELDGIRWTAYPNPTEGRIILRADGKT